MLEKIQEAYIESRHQTRDSPHIPVIKTNEPPSQPKGRQEDKISKAYGQAASRQSATHRTAQIYRTSYRKTILKLCLLIFPAEN
ncbi:hypothetical protein F2Q70_00027939 [Brassica cretica]|uniref:Uncharacterized protein n=1 Tax=Brassica cretica TaxID=69181 RepID=A0A8S9IKD0_BRACR|nr:hypothetical protein F2Q68_00027526 [Brassica cretica]KAF2605599.1 hypothetical protein F2Q70_00027939 [Brassica cretica]